MMDESKIRVHFTNRPTITFDRPLTLDKLKIGIANSIDRFATEIDIFFGHLLEDGDSTDIPPEVNAVVTNRDYGQTLMWRETIRFHGLAHEPETVCRALQMVGPLGMGLLAQILVEALREMDLDKLRIEDSDTTDTACSEKKNENAADPPSNAAPPSEKWNNKFVETLLEAEQRHFLLAHSRYDMRVSISSALPADGDGEVEERQVNDECTNEESQETNQLELIIMEYSESVERLSAHFPQFRWTCKSLLRGSEISAQEQYF